MVMSAARFSVAGVGPLGLRNMSGPAAPRPVLTSSQLGKNSLMVGMNDEAPDTGIFLGELRVVG